MEKLHKALAKARQMREELTSAPQREQNVASPKLPELKTSSGADAAWAELPGLELDPKALAANRIVTLYGSMESNPYDVLRTRLREKARQNGARRIVITSPEAEAGKSTVTNNLAFSFGRMPFFRTMVMDLDLRRPSMNAILCQSVTHNMGKVVSGEVSPEQHFCRVGDNLAFGMNNGPVPHSSELLQSDRMSALLNELEAKYQPDLMLFDMPPLMAADDTYGFLRNVDGVILVVEAERSSLNQVDILEQKLSELTNVMGVVLNKCRFTQGDESTSYGYY